MNSLEITVGNTADTAAKLRGLSAADKEKLAAEIGIGELTLNDIIDELMRPGRDPREDMPKPILRSDVLEMKDLEVGMVLKGTVRNVIDFGKIQGQIGSRRNGFLELFLKIGCGHGINAALKGYYGMVFLKRFFDRKHDFLLFLRIEAADNRTRTCTGEPTGT